MKENNEYKIVFIGSGNVATHYAHAFSEEGMKIIQIYSQTLQYAKELADQFHASYTDNIAQLDISADIYVFAVSDDAIFDVASRIATVNNAICFHTSGTVPISVLGAVTNNYGVIYAPQTFVKHIEMDYKKLSFCIEASNYETQENLAQLARKISSQVYTVTEKQRKHIHLAAVFANNFCNCINAIAQEIIEQEQLPFEILYPLIDETAQRSKQGKVYKLQTGPAKRKDTKIIESQQQLLGKNTKYVELYKIFTSIIQQQQEEKL